MMPKLPPEVIKGLQAFNQGEYYEAHEHFERAWRETSDNSREFYRALIMLSGGYYRLTQGRPDAARKFFTRALEWLDPFSSPYAGVNTMHIKTRLEKLIEAVNSGQTSEVIHQQHTGKITWDSQEEPK